MVNCRLLSAPWLGRWCPASGRQLEGLAVASLPDLRVTGERAVEAHAGLALVGWLAARPCLACPWGAGVWGRDHADGVCHADSAG
jgi:hypothetical protein